MENPCKKCLIKVSCTAVCLEKKNYGTLLKNAIGQYKDAVIHNRKTSYSREYQKLLTKSAIHHCDISEINQRKLDCLSN